ncbi:MULTISPECIES: hypothetical protein [unclassified Chelatococcus]|uniref:hypothetical protein n=1 Tax=unclassified Chelatococcus TaxID=2638111 RepID=UPI001BCCCFCD|nr:MULTISPECIES: hypothetical protein [unclassified Chelatococcus]MBS7698516.1 hypothetical protein [Chelatococcus sp. YT9]MBX3554833.1 hypothetical protein [Chelatococcus sp.]
MRKFSLIVVISLLGINSAFAYTTPDCDTVVAETSGGPGTLTVTANRDASMGTNWLISGGGCEIYDVQAGTGLGDRQTAAITVSRPMTNLTQWRCEAKSDPGRIETYKLRAIGIFCRLP